MTTHRKTHGPMKLIALPIVGAILLFAMANPAQASGRRGHHSHHRHTQHHHHHDVHHRTHVSGSIHIGNGDFGIRIGVNHAPRQRWVEGHYVTRVQRVLVHPAHTERVYVPPVYQTRYDHWGCAHQVLVRSGYYTTVHHPAVYETREVREWVPGCYVAY